MLNHLPLVCSPCITQNSDSIFLLFVHVSPEMELKNHDEIIVLSSVGILSFVSNRFKTFPHEKIESLFAMRLP